jgi:hypothetical protein
MNLTAVKRMPIHSSLRDNQPTQTLFKESFAHIHYQPVRQLLVVKWIGYLQLADLQRACQLLLDQIGQLGITSLYCEQTELKPLSQSVKSWLVTECFPAAAQRGLRKVAILLSEDEFAQASVNEVNQNVEGSLQIQSFSANSLAMEWLWADEPVTNNQ